MTSQHRADEVASYTSSCARSGRKHASIAARTQSTGQLTPVRARDSRRVLRLYHRPPQSHHHHHDRHD